jgi:hypothetical protein
MSPYLTYLHVGERYREEVFTVLVQLGEVVEGLAAGNMVRKSQEKRLEIASQTAFEEEGQEGV